MKKLLFCIITVCCCAFISPAIAQKLSEKFPQQIKAIMAAKDDIGKIKGEKVSEAGEFKSKLPLEEFAVYYNEPEDDDPYIMAVKAVESNKADAWMNEISATLKKLAGYTVKDSWKDKEFFTGFRETSKHKLVLLKGEDAVLTVVDNRELGSNLEIWFH